MRSVKVSEATGPVLDWMVGEAEFRRFQAQGSSVKAWVLEEHKKGLRTDPYSTSWAHGGPIIEREEISTWFHADYGCWCAAGIDWMSADVSSDEFMAMPDAFRGPTPLIAAMRCLVASKLGDEVEVPDGLAS